jgi:hypothetical protein
MEFLVLWYFEEIEEVVNGTLKQVRALRIIRITAQGKI